MPWLSAVVVVVTIETLVQYWASLCAVCDE